MRDGHGSTDAYYVAKYGQKWVRTRTIIDTYSPKWTEQYTWEVYDSCSIITLGVFHNCHLGGSEKATTGTATRDTKIGKKMGELQLAVRFTSLSLAIMIYIYGQPLLPKMHYLRPFTVNQIESLRYQTMNIVAGRLGRAEPPLKKEVVEYMLDADSHMWSMGRSKDSENQMLF
ncbi:unnamed protein product [Sphenostylis stenocarpa]|uniref:C2 domain-containing protein n=1 Tax=Sphenostylis stenocarpa TaxID=92480 RepID=A0AA86T2A9_9FABA|nr:unnamed protein product [Sphenostylis stenocarpa]